MIFFRHCLMKVSLIDGFHTLKNGWFCIMAGADLGHFRHRQLLAGAQRIAPHRTRSAGL